MSYWKKCLSTGDYQYITTGEPAPGDIVVQWWEVELARKDKRIAELENLLSLAEQNRLFHRANIEKSTDGSLNICWGEHEKWEDCEYVRYYPEQRIVELEAQLPKAVTPKIGTHFYFCECGCVVGYSERYCGQCGRKLNWRDA